MRELFPRDLRISSADGPAEEAVTVGGLIATCHRGWPDSGIAARWDDLLASASHATPFHSRAWLQLGIGPSVDPSRLRVITVRDGERLLLIVPLVLSDNGFLDTLGRDISDYLDPLASPGDEEPAWGAALALLRQRWDGNLKGVTLHNIRPDAACRQILFRVAPEAGLLCEESAIDTSARLTLPATWDDYLATLDPHERKELKRKIRKAQTQVAAQLRLTDATNFSDASLAIALDLVEAAGGQKAEFFRAAVRPVLQRVGSQLVNDGRMRLHTLLIENQPAAALIEFPSPTGPLMYNGGFDPALRQWSPGVITFALAIQQSIERGDQIFDFLRGREDYKYRLGATDVPLYRIALSLR